MAPGQCISRLGGWEGYQLVEYVPEVRNGQHWCVLRLEAIRGRPWVCSGCGRPRTTIHDLQERRVRDLPLFEYRIELIVPRVRVECPACGPKLERPA